MPVVSEAFTLAFDAFRAPFFHGDGGPEHHARLDQGPVPDRLGLSQDPVPPGFLLQKASCGLNEGFHHEHPGHDGEAREVVGQIILVWPKPSGSLGRIRTIRGPGIQE